MRIIVVIIIISFFITGCYNTLLPFKIPTKSPKIPKNSIDKDITRYHKNSLGAFYKFTKQKQKQLNLSIPENGFDSLMIRMWFTYPENLYQFGELLEIRITSDNKQIIEYYKLDIFFNPTREYEVINFYSDTLISSPKKGWSELISQINKSRLMELPTMEKLPQFKSLTEKSFLFENTSLTVSTEISSKKTYRFFIYNNFEKYQDIDEVDKMFTFIKYIREDLYMFPIDTNWYKE